MADPEWKSRVGLEINLSSSDEDKTPPSERFTSQSPTTGEYEDPIAPLSPTLALDVGVEYAVDPYLDLGRTPPRTRILRHMKEKRMRDSLDHTPSRSMLRKQDQKNRSRRRNSSVDLRRNNFIDNSPERNFNLKFGEEKLNRNRSLKFFRDIEMDLTTSTFVRDDSSFNFNSEDRAESMPTFVVKVGTKRFMSVASRPVMFEHEIPVDVRMTENKEKNECRDRVEFYNTFSLLIRMGNPERQQEKNCRKQMSKEETLWQSGRNDMIWLELQAWLADRSPSQQDIYLCEARKHVGTLLAEVAAYHFNPGLHLMASAKDSIDSGVSGIEHVSCQCLSMYCLSCVVMQNTALEQVETLLSHLEEAVALYPSSRAMTNDHPVFDSDHFTAKLRALCLWYNMTRLLRLKVRIIGKLLHQLRTHRGGSMSSSHAWPLLDEIKTPSPSATQEGFAPETTPSSQLRGKSVHQVQFHMSDIDSPIASTSPSESNSSTGSATSNVTPWDTVLSSSRNSLENSGNSPRSSRYCGDAPVVLPRKENTSQASCTSSPYRAYIEDVLKSQGLKKAMQYLDRLHHHLLSKARIALDMSSQSTLQEMDDEERELRRYGHGSQEAQTMGLPSYRSAFLFLARIPLDLIHEYLRLRLEQKPSEPSPLSIRQLMREMKEGLREGVKQRQRYVHLMRTAVWGASQDVVDRLEQDVADFDRSMKAILEVYLEYLQQWVLMVQKDSVLICPYQKTLLEEEWSFVKITCPYIPNGEALAAVSFCRMASGMLNAIVDHLNSGVDGLTSQLDENNAVLEQEESNLKQGMLTACRGIQSVFHEARERALRAVAFAKTLRKDLEIAASFELVAPLEDFLVRLWQAGHVRVVAPHSCSHLMFVPVCLKDKHDLVCRLLNMNLITSCMSNKHSEEQDYLVLARCNQSDRDQFIWPGETISVQPTAETTITLSHVEVQGVLLVVCDPGQLARNRRHLAQVLGSCVTLTQESLPSNYTIAESLSELKLDAVSVRDCLTSSIEAVERSCDVRAMVQLDDTDRASLASRCREILHQCYKFGFEYNKEVSRLITGKAEGKLALGMIEFAKQWMRFVRERCERGRGLRPRWATQGLDFLVTAFEPEKTKYLTNEEFEELKKEIDACISHVIGSAEKCPPRTVIVNSRSRDSSPATVNRRTYRSSRSLSDKPDAQTGIQTTQTKRSLSNQTTNNVNSVSSTPDLLESPESARHPLELSSSVRDGNIAESLRIPSKLQASWQERVQYAVAQLEKQQDNNLKSQNLIGSVTEIHQPDRVHIKARSVTFSWQRGIKLGQGRFGKVYTAVNNATGELMAMKEIAFQPNDHRTIRSVSEELHILEGIKHNHLVRYYGVEIHREEMLIFMEYCEEGTLESLVAAYPTGLPEQQVRSFTRQLLLAVNTLHHHGIVHRDIKTANIFLTDEGNCLKLGDFGSAVKIKTHTTMQGELQGFVGTQAYMAPEVFMTSNNDGYGRAADIWSVGCVVVEMASGKRPWHEYDSNYQIMFKVGMGEVPACPDSLSEEGHAFLELCLRHEPRDRSLAAELLEHPFVKVELEHEEEYGNDNVSNTKEQQKISSLENNK